MRASVLLIIAVFIEFGEGWLHWYKYVMKKLLNMSTHLTPKSVFIIWCTIQTGHCIHFARTTTYMGQSVKEAIGVWLLHNNFNIEMVCELKKQEGKSEKLYCLYENISRKKKQ
jgi:hypothetical protein